jgi:hypothetical protein
MGILDTPGYSVAAAKKKFAAKGKVANLSAPATYDLAFPPVHPSPPTLTWGTASVVTSPVQIPAFSPQVAFPGTILKNGSNYVEASAGNGTPTGLTVAFDYTGKKFSIVLRSSVNSGQYYRLTVDGKPVTAQQAQAIGIAATAGQLVYLTVDFGATVAARRIELEVYLMGFFKLEVGPQDSVSPIVRNKRRIGIITDSFGGGANQANDGVCALDTYPTHLARILGVEVFNGGQGGSGYANNGKGNVSGNEVFGHTSRVDPMLTAGLDELWFWGSVNDANVTYSAGAGAGAAAAYSYVKAQAPDLPVYVFGVQPSTPPDATMWGYHFSTQLALKNAANAAANVRAFVDLAGHYGATIPAWAFNTAYVVGDKFTFAGSVWTVFVAHTSAGSGVPNSGYAAPIGAFYGTGWSSSPQNNGNRDVMLSNDTVHPTFLGSRHLAIASARAYLTARAAE